MDSKNKNLSRRKFMMLGSGAVASPLLLGATGSAAMAAEKPAETTMMSTSRYNKILPERCVCCVGCVVFCPTNAISYAGNHAYQIDPEKCIKCNTCVQYCNHSAIVDPEKPIMEATLHAQKTLDCDVCVVGGGPGITAAVRAAQAGKKVVVLEKGYQLGGCAWYAMGFFARGSKTHLAAAGEDQRDLYVKEITEKFKGQIDPEMISKAIYANGPFYDWITEFNDLDGKIEIQSSIGGPGGGGGGAPQQGQGEMPAGGGGSSMGMAAAVSAVGLMAGERFGVGRQFILALRNAIEDLDITVLTQHEAVEIGTEKGAVSYVKAKDPGGYTQVNCKAVLLSTGGFQGSQELREELIPEVKDIYFGHNAHGLPELTGDGMTLAQSVGAMIDKDAFRLDVLSQISQPMSAYLLAHCKADEMKINLLGKRVANEADGGGMISRETIMKQPLGVTYTISDQPLWDARNTAELANDKGKIDPYAFTEDMMEEKDAFLNATDKPLIMADTLEDLADQMGIDPKVFIETVNRYNQFCDNGKDEDFGKPASNLNAIKTAPFYAVRNLVHPHGASCGVAVTPNMEVKAEKGGVVSGLYASGDLVSPSLGSESGILRDLTWAFTGAYMASDSILDYLES